MMVDVHLYPVGSLGWALLGIAEISCARPSNAVRQEWG